MMGHLNSFSASGVGLSRFCSEKAKKLLRSMPNEKVAKKLLKIKKVAQKFCEVARIFYDNMSNFDNNCFVISLRVSLTN